MSRPKALLFDVNGTLFPADAAAMALRELGLPASAVDVWFSRVLRDGFAAQLAGAQLSFKQFAQHHLSCLMAAHPGTAAAGVAAEEAIERVLAAWASADLFPDVPPALRALHAGGLKLAVLTNGSADLIARRALQKAGLEGAFAALLDIQAAGAWKPSPSSYAHAVRELGLRPEEVMLVASHPWDVFGALQTGLQAAYVQREAWDPYPAFLPRQPQLVVASFGELAAALLAPA